MLCSKPKCTSNDNKEAFISCWLCDNIFHARCVGLTARVADNLLENKGLRWCCQKCMVYDVKFFSFIKKSISEFENINNDLLQLTEKFKKYKQLFHDVSALDNYLESLSKSPKRKKTSDHIITQSNNHDTMAKKSHPTPQSVMMTAPPTIVLDDAVTMNNSNEIQNPPINPPVPLNFTASTSKSVSAINNPIPNILKVVSKKKTIFAARFAAETTEDDVAYYVKNKLGANIEVNVFKFKYFEKRSKSSFKVIVPEEVFETVVNPDFWPEKAIIHEYLYRESVQSNIVHLPARLSDDSKN